MDELKAQMSQDVEKINTIFSTNPDLKVTIQYINQKSENKLFNSRSIFTLVFIALIIIILQLLTQRFHLFNVFLTTDFQNVIEYILIAILIVSLVFISVSEKNKVVDSSIGYRVLFTDGVDPSLFAEILQIFEDTLNFLLKREEFGGETLKIEKRLFSKSFFLVLLGPILIIEQIINIHANLIASLSDQFEFVAEISDV